MSEQPATPKETFWPNGRVRSRLYKNAKGEYHRDPSDGPAFQMWNSGVLMEETYYENGKVHRPARDGPAYRSWYPNGHINCEVYREHGKRHRPVQDGPARIAWNIYGKLVSEKYWENDKEFEVLETSETKSASKRF